MRSTINYIVCLFLIAGNQGAFSQDKDSIAGPLPSSNHFENWIIEDSIRIYNANDLYRYEDADVNLVTEYGFDTLTTCSYFDPERNRFLIEIYKMEDADAAFGLFTMNNSGKGNRYSIGEEGFLFDHFIHFIKGKYYVKCTSSDNNQDYIDQLLKFAGYVNENIKDTGRKPALINALNFEDYKINNLKYFEGQYGLSNVFSFGHSAFAGFIAGVYGRDKEKLFFTFSYENEHSRREWFASAKGKIKMNKKFSDLTYVEDGFTVKDKNNLYLSFKPYDRYIFVVRGFNWEESQPVFEKMKSNLQNSDH